MGAVPTESSTGTMETLFRPSTRFRYSNRNRRGRPPEGLTELELLPGLTTENVRATGVTWEDFLLFLRDKLVWMTPGVFICSDGFDSSGYPWVLVLEGDVYGRTKLIVHVRLGTATAAATATCDFLVRFFGDQ
jgi:hypothetical protein